jgi:hypothetical protein
MKVPLPEGYIMHFPTFAFSPRHLRLLLIDCGGGK